MGMLFGGWAREDAEEELFYIKKYGLEAGELAYKLAQEKQAEQRKYNQEHPTPTIWSTTEPRVTKSDIIIMDGDPSKQFYITRIEGDDIYGTMVTIDPMKDDVKHGGEWCLKGMYKVLR